MKLFTVVLAMVLLSLSAFSQDDLANDSLKIIIKEPALSFKKGLIEKEVLIPIVSYEDTIQPIDIKAEYWETNVYNPYRNTLVKYPIGIAFSDTTYTSPVLHKKVVTSRYGWRRGRPHKGIDIDLVTGDSVVAMLDGIVRYASYARGFGKTIVVRHYNGLETTYAHLSNIAVKANDSISRGQYIGKGGNTGNSRGSHLHLEVSYKGEYIHPEYVFDFSPKNAIRAKTVWVTQKWTRPQYHNSRRVSKVNVLKSEEEVALASLMTKREKVYVVKKGDTLYGISRRNNISINSICDANAITKSTTLKIGQKLVLEP
ncbi:M23 family metallopeptidase [Winogradskyella flava]|uniref:M23 family metallopeptidase n=1 Tax=Winogradskyella flava TaxID=1884876 RepID=UPI0024911475|nr:M23 family metallopeptidase [Winogradskyella flava]